MRAKDRHDRRRETDRAAAPFRLRLDEAPALPEPLQRLTHPQHAPIEIQIRPAEQLTFSETATHGHDDERIQPVPGDGCQERTRLIGG